MLKLNDLPQEPCKTNSDTQGKPPSTPLILEGYIRRAELARMLDVTERTVYRWELLRIGPPRVVVGSLILYKIASLKAWLTSREQQLPGNGRKGIGGRKKTQVQPLVKHPHKGDAQAAHPSSAPDAEPETVVSSCKAPLPLKGTIR